MRAFILATIEPRDQWGVLASVKNEVAEMDGVVRTYNIFGRYDLIIEVEVNDLEELGTLVSDTIRSIAGVKTTETFICMTDQ